MEDKAYRCKVGVGVFLGAAFFLLVLRCVFGLTLAVAGDFYYLYAFLGCVGGAIGLGVAFANLNFKVKVS